MATLQLWTQCSWTDKLEGPAGWTSWTDQLDGPVLYTWSLGQFAYLKIDVSVCTLSQLLSPMKALFFTNIFWNQNFFSDTNSFSSPKLIFWPQSFLAQICFWLKLFWGPKFSWGSKFFLAQHYFWAQQNKDSLKMNTTSIWRQTQNEDYLKKKKEKIKWLIT